MSEDSRPRGVLVGVQLPGVTDEEHESSLNELGRLAKTLGIDVVARVAQKRSSLAASAVVGEGKLAELARFTGGSGVVPSGVPEYRQRRSKAPASAADDGENSASFDEEASPSEDGFASAEGGGETDDGSAGGRGSRRAIVRGGAPASVVLVDHDISPSQARNLERATGAEVLDRTAVILAIFQRHAHSREARLQVEIARLAYMAPRLRETGGGKDRQGGGIGGKGAGESQIELDRRKVRDRIAELRRELVSIERSAATRRQRRAAQPAVAIVGYTNAGKSSLMRALTGSELLVADQLFATLDTTVRALQPETRPRILISDTVGFIKKLPHDLVASFRSTLDEAREAALLLHVVDGADPAFPSQIEVTEQVLGEIGADVPRLLVLNKMDKLDDGRRAALAAAHPEALLMCAKSPADVALLRQRIVEFFEREMIEEELVIPYALQRVVSEVHATCRVLAEDYDETGTRLRVRGRPEVVARLRAAL